MKEEGLRHTSRLTAEGIKRVKVAGASTELRARLSAWDENDEEKESDYAVALEYLTNNFERQADGMRALKGINDPDVRRQRALALLQRRKEVLNSINDALANHPFTQLEADQLLWTYDMGSAFINQITKEMGLFNAQYGIDKSRGAILSNLTTTEMQQSLAEMMIRQDREASDVEAPSGRASRRYIEEVVFPLFNTMAVKAMGLADGSRLYNIVETGVYGTAAAYHVYSDPKLNRFGKSFHVVFPTPYMDAFEQTDLLLIDEEGMSDEIKGEITQALDKMYTEEKRDTMDALSREAKKFVYKVQVKTRGNGPSGLTSDETVERDRFVSARCRSKGFDNYDYLVLNSVQARNIVQQNKD